MASKKFYVVWKGKKPGIYPTWDDCKDQVQGFQGAQFKAFKSKEEAEQAYNQAAEVFLYSKTERQVERLKDLSGGPDLNSICVDAACSGNPGILEYRGVYTETGTEFFKKAPIPVGTNNIGEFLAIVHALALLKKEESKIPIYTDSETALAWIKNKKIKSKLERNETTEALWQLVERAQTWLENNTYDNVLLKWDTKGWGEIIADYGRK